MMKVLIVVSIVCFGDHFNGFRLAHKKGDKQKQGETRRNKKQQEATRKAPD